MSSGGGGITSSASGSRRKDFKPTGPLVTPKDGSKVPVPLGIYPPGLDLYGHLIIWPDGSTDVWSKELMAKYEATRENEPNGPQPENGGSGGGEPSCGFYRVVRTGTHLFGLTNGTVLHGEVELPIEIGANIQADDIILMASGDNPAFSEIATNAQGQLVMKWNTQFVPNGTYVLQLQATEGIETEVLSATRMVTVSNEIWFDDFTTSFGNQLWIVANLQSANADYEIAMHDGTSGQYLGSFIDQTTDGTINFVWDLTDGQGNAFTNESFRADFNLSANSGPVTNAGSRFFGKEESSVGDQFLVARAEDFNEFHANAFNNYHPTVYHGVVDVLGNPAADDPYTLSPGNISLADSTFQFTTQTKPDFYSYLTNMSYQNFFWMGHGSETTLAYHIHQDNGSVSLGDGLRATVVAKMLRNGPTIRRHPYRFTFLHACRAAKGRKWSNAFGIPREAVSVAHFQVKGVRARALVGNNGNPGLWSEESQLFYAESFAMFYAAWMANVPVSSCLYAATNAPSPGETRRALPTFPDAVWVIHGAQDLQRYGP